MITQHNTKTLVAHRLEQLANLYRQDYASDIMVRTVDKFLLYEAETCQQQLRQLDTDLAEYEQRYGMTSADFYEQFCKGDTDDRMDYVEWASLFQMAQRLEKQVALLTGAEDA